MSDVELSATSGVVTVPAIDIGQLPQSMYDFITSYEDCRAGSFFELNQLLARADGIGRREPKHAGLREVLEADLCKDGIDPKAYVLVLIWR